MCLSHKAKKASGAENTWVCEMALWLGSGFVHFESKGGEWEVPCEVMFIIDEYNLFTLKRPKHSG